jgi:putative peptidoglycan lipid II flippase
MPLTDTRVLLMAKLVLPLMLSALFARSTSLFERFFASGLPDGNLSYLGYAYKISNIMVLVLANSIASAIFPAMARAYSEYGEKGLKKQAEYGLRLSFAVALPVLGISGAIAVPLVTVLFERGAFQQSDTLNISRIVLIVMLGDVLLRMLGNVIGRTFYVLKDTYTFPIVTAITAGLYIPFGMILAKIWGYIGLASATPIQMGLGILVVSLLLIRKLPTFQFGRMFRDVSFYLVASLIASLVAWLISGMMASLPALLQLFFAFTSAGILYLLILSRRDWLLTTSILEMMGLQRVVKAASFVWQNREPTHE